MKTLTLQEAAAFLHLHPCTLLDKIKSGFIPASKPGKRWVLFEVDLIEYLRSNSYQQALQGDNEELSCHSIKEQAPLIGGSSYQSMVKKSMKVLKLPTER